MEKKVAKAINIFLTGNPGVGKTTAIKRIVEYLSSKGIPSGGFYTEEQRSESGTRTGFVIKTLLGNEGIMASVGPGKGPKVGKYIVNTKSIDDIAVTSIKEAITSGKNGDVFDKI